MKVFFCKSWFRAKKCPTEMWSEDQAKVAHENGLPYTALIGAIEQPYCFLEVSKKTVGVGFLDKYLRESLSYAFQEVEDGRLFLTMATHREFEGDTDKVKSGTSYIFSRDGAVSLRREFFNPHKLETSATNTDVTANYSPKPEFGQYEDLIRAERNS